MRAGLAVALALDGEPRAVGVDGRHHHLVHRQRAGLVGVDRARRTRASRRRSGSSRSPSRRRAASPPTTAGPTRTPACPSGSPRSPSRCPSSRTLAERPAAGDADDDDERDRGPGDDPEHLGQRAELLLQRRPRARDRGQHRRDLAHLGLHAGRGHDHRAPCPGSPPCSGTACSSGRRARRPSPAARRRPSATGALSPVSAASCVSSVAEWRIRPSAGTMSPASTCDDVAGNDVDRRHQRERAVAHAPSPAAPAGSRARRRSPGPSAPGASRERR